MQIGHRGADRRELIPEVAVERVEVVGQDDLRPALVVEDRVAVVDVHHVGALDERVREVHVLGVEGVVDLERPAALRQRARNVHVALEVARVARQAAGGDAVKAGAGVGVVDVRGRPGRAPSLAGQRRVLRLVTADAHEARDDEQREGRSPDVASHGISS